MEDPVQEGRGRAVKREKQGSRRLSAFGRDTSSFQWPLMQGGIDFHLQFSISIPVVKSSRPIVVTGFSIKCFGELIG